MDGLEANLAKMRFLGVEEVESKAVDDEKSHASTSCSCASDACTSRSRLTPTIRLPMAMWIRRRVRLVVSAAE